MKNRVIPFSMLLLPAAEYLTQIAVKFRKCKASNMKKYRPGQSPELAELMIWTMTKYSSFFYISILSVYL